MTAVQTVESQTKHVVDRWTPTRKPNVFLMVNSLEIGGSERQFTYVANALDKELFHVRLGCLKRTGGLLDKIAKIKEFDPGGNFYGLQAHRTRSTLLKYLRSLEFAVCHSFDFYTNMMLIPAARLAAAPVIIASHRQLGDLLTPIKRRIQGAFFRLCDCVVCNSRAAANQLIDQGLPNRKVVVIFNGIPDSAFAHVEPAFPRLPNSLRVTMIARMNDPSKNHEAFLRVAAKIAARVPNAEYLLVGDGPLRSSLEELAQKLNLTGRTRFLGARDDIASVLAATDVLALPSLSESLPNVIIEAMAAGVPVVATSVGGIPELVKEGHTGFLTPRGDETRFAAVIEHLLMSPGLRTTFGERGRKLALANYNLDRIRDQYEDLYISLLEEKLYLHRIIEKSRNR